MFSWTIQLLPIKRARGALLIFPPWLLGPLYARIWYLVSWEAKHGCWVFYEPVLQNSYHTKAQTQKNGDCKLYCQREPCICAPRVWLSLGFKVFFHCDYGIIRPLHADDYADWFLPLHSSVIPNPRFNFLLVLLLSSFVQTVYFGALRLSILLLFFLWQWGSSALPTVTAFLVILVVGVTRNK